MTMQTTCISSVAVIKTPQTRPLTAGWGWGTYLSFQFHRDKSQSWQGGKAAGGRHGGGLRMFNASVASKRQGERG